jgi:hypothetical protein
VTGADPQRRPARPRLPPRQDAPLNRKTRQRPRRSFLQKALSAGLVAGILASLVAGLVFFEYRTNGIARRVGAYLVAANPGREAAGELWAHIENRQKAQETLADTSRAMEDAEADPGRPTLPPVVQACSFQMLRVPESGMPDFLSLTIRPGPSEDATDAPRLATARRLHDVIGRLLSEATLPGDDPHDMIERRVHDMLAAGEASPSGLDGSAPLDGAAAAEPLAADSSLAGAVREVVTDALRREATEGLLRNLENGYIRQILINRGPDGYEGEMFHDDPESPPVAFRLRADVVARVLGISRAGGSP